MIKPAFLVVAAFTAGLAVPAASSAAPVVTAVTSAQPSPAAQDGIDGFFRDGRAGNEAARIVPSFYKKTIRRMGRGLKRGP